MGTFFVILVYLWVVLGLDAIQIGMHLLPRARAPRWRERAPG
jgi:hypothetical protein